MKKKRRKLLLSCLHLYLPSYRDLITLKVRVLHLLSGPCATLMTGNLSWIINCFSSLSCQGNCTLRLPCLWCNTLYFCLHDRFICLSPLPSCRNRLLMCILNMCKDVLGRLPKVVGIDIVEMALWAKVRALIYNIYYNHLNYSM